MSEQDPVKLMAQASTLLEGGDPVAATGLIEQVVDAEPEQTMAWLLLGRARLLLGEISGAESACRQAIKLQPGLAAAHYLLGNIFESADRAEAAAEYYEKTVTLEPGNTMAITRLGIIRHHQGQLDTAIEHYRRALKLNPYLPIAHFSLGIACKEQQKYAEAEDCFTAVSRIQKNYPRVYAHLGYVLGIQGKREDSIAAYKQALMYEPNNAVIYRNIALEFSRQGDTDEALNQLQTAIRLDPDYTDAHLDLGGLLQSGGNFSEAEKTFRQAISINPDNASGHQKLATILNTVGRQDEAVASCIRALQLEPDNVDAHIAMSAASITLQNAELAQEHCKKALELAPDDINVIALAANLSNYLGDKEDAYKRLKPLLADTVNHADPEHINIALTFAQISKHVGKQAEAIALLENLLHNPSLPDANRINLLFNLGKLYDATGEYDKAFSNFRQGNTLKPVTFDTIRHSAEVDTIIDTFNPGFMMQMPRATVRSDRPVFVVGMARSGTSLVEQILSSHPEVFGAGELMNLIQVPLSLPGFLGTERQYPQCLPLLTQDKMDVLARNYLASLHSISPDSSRVIDKMPGNFMHLGLIEFLFPDARVIHCVRSSLDTCLSCYFQDFSRSHHYSYDLENLGALYLDYMKIIQHWKSLLSIPILDVQYEDLIMDQESVSRSLTDFCGLEWDEQCMDFHKTERFVGTASYDQVKQPIYRKSVQRWKHYEAHLGPLRKALHLDNGPAN